MIEMQTSCFLVKMPQTPRGASGSSSGSGSASGSNFGRFVFLSSQTELVERSRQPRWANF
jgi:hypothetical protein